MDKEKLIARQSELIRIVEAIDEVLHTREWQTIREVFDTRVEALEKQILLEASAEIDIKKLYYLQGQKAEIKRYDLATYAEACKKELQGLKNINE